MNNAYIEFRKTRSDKGRKRGRRAGTAAKVAAVAGLGAAGIAASRKLNNSQAGQNLKDNVRVAASDLKNQAKAAKRRASVKISDTIEDAKGKVKETRTKRRLRSTQRKNIARKLRG